MANSSLDIAWKPSKEARQLSTTLLNEYSDVLSDELSSMTPMRTKQRMRIILHKDYMPFQTLSARRVALRFEAEAAKTIDELIAKKVITWVNETTKWCSPACFVPEGD